jgi:hypothetical protein
VVFCLPRTRRWIESKASPIALYNIQHRQNPFKSIWISSVTRRRSRLCFEFRYHPNGSSECTYFMVLRFVLICSISVLWEEK